MLFCINNSYDQFYKKSKMHLGVTYIATKNTKTDLIYYMLLLRVGCL